MAEKGTDFRGLINKMATDLPLISRAHFFASNLKIQPQLLLKEEIKNCHVLPDLDSVQIVVNK
ncbi:hypothetical protein NC652_041642 [Populus alba x Populus x berolinensis]|nr:hypothetical protein NC652_041642 [Populus alba x Populus x berolinensis]